jgi:4'-phosphopantetheinyl transferase
MIAATVDPLLTFNMSHSGDMMILGLTRNGLIGVDVEMIDPKIDIFQIAEDHFTTVDAA